MTNNRQENTNRYYDRNNDFSRSGDKDKKVQYNGDKISLKEQDKQKEKEIHEIAKTIISIESAITKLKGKYIDLEILVDKFQKTECDIHHERSILDNFMNNYKHDNSKRERAKDAFKVCSKFYGLLIKYENHVKSMNTCYKDLHDDLDKANKYIKEIEGKDKKPGGYLSKDDKEKIEDFTKLLIKHSRKAIDIKANHETYTLDKKTLQDFKEKSTLPQETRDMFVDKKRYQNK